MELKLVEKTSKKILERLENYEMDDEYGECKKSVLNKIVGNGDYVCDRDNVYIRAKDGLLVIPYYATHDNENYIVYEVLSLSIAYLAQDNMEKINKVIEEKEDFLNMLKYYVTNPDVCDEEDIIGEILEDGTIERGETAQGMVYKNPNAFKNKEGICYVPELHNVEYTYDDFLEITNDHEVAELLFKRVDWQSPETLFDEWLNEDEVYVCKKCDKSYLSYEVDNCPHCKEPKVLD